MILNLTVAACTPQPNLRRAFSTLRIDLTIRTIVVRPFRAVRLPSLFAPHSFPHLQSLSSGLGFFRMHCRAGCLGAKDTPGDLGSDRVITNLRIVTPTRLTG
jgi:hypothetical protein